MKKCWAQDFGGCHEKITGEHLISNGLLDDVITVSGFNWCKDKSVSIGRSSLVSNFLCKTHNEALSPYDSEMLNFKKSITAFERNFKLVESNKMRLVANKFSYRLQGFQIERWFLKTIINLCLVNKSEALINFDLLLPILFGDSKFQKPYGLNFAVKPNLPLSSTKNIHVVPIFNETAIPKELAGGMFQIHGLSFVLLIPVSIEAITAGKFYMQSDPLGLEGTQLNWHNDTILNTVQTKSGPINFQSIKINWD